MIVLGCAAYQYFRGTIVKSFVMLLSVVCASVAAFAYYEMLAGILIAREMMANWAQPISFFVVLVISFAVLFTLANTLIRQPIKFPALHEHIGGAVVGVFLGLFVSGLLLTALAMAPIPAKYPYERFEGARPDVDKPSRALLNPDGLVTGLMALVSRGSMAGDASFSVLHARFIDQLFLNRSKLGEEVSLIADPGAIEVGKKACWPAPEGLMDSRGNAITQKVGHTLTVVRVGFTAKAIKMRAFTLSQLAVICKRNTERERLTGSGIAVYPIGYLKNSRRIQVKPLNEQIEIERTDIKGQSRGIDFLVWAPEGFQPVAVRFKQNAATLPPLVAADQAPEPAPFVKTSDCANISAGVEPIAAAKVYGVNLGLGMNFLADLSLSLTGQNAWEAVQAQQSKRPAIFDGDQVACTQAVLRIEPQREPNQPAPQSSETTESTGEQTEKQSKAGKLFKVPAGYRLLSLKCNNPATGAAIAAEQLPVLVEITGTVHNPVGVIASAKLDTATVYEVDFCVLYGDQAQGGLTLAQDGSVAKPFPDTVWLTEQAKSINEFYVLYMVKAAAGVVIASVRPAGVQTDAGFEKYEGFVIN